MTGVHSLLGSVLVVAIGGNIMLTVVTGITNRPADWLRWVRLAPAGIILVQTVAGLVLVFIGARPAEVLHFVYGGAMLLAVVATPAITTSFPAGWRWVVSAGVSTILLAIAWRLLETG